MTVSTLPAVGSPTKSARMAGFFNNIQVNVGKYLINRLLGQFLEGDEIFRDQIQVKEDCDLVLFSLSLKLNFYRPSIWKP